VATDGNVDGQTRTQERRDRTGHSGASQSFNARSTARSSTGLETSARRVVANPSGGSASDGRRGPWREPDGVTPHARTHLTIVRQPARDWLQKQAGLNHAGVDWK